MSKKKEDGLVEPPENSVPLRVASCLLSLLCIIAACHYVHASALATFLYIWGALSGSYVSYQHRHKQSLMIKWVTSVGVLIVIGTFAEELFHQWLDNHLDAFVPFIRVLTGLLALHTFELRSRSDTSISALIGLGLFCCTAVLAKDLLFAGFAFLYIILGTALLYWEAVARTQAAGTAGQEAGTVSLSREHLLPPTARGSTGSALVAVSLLPILSVMLFFFLPRTNSILDQMVNTARRMQGGESVTIPLAKESASVNPFGITMGAKQNGEGGLGVPATQSDSSPFTAPGQLNGASGTQGTGTPGVDGSQPPAKGLAGKGQGPTGALSLTVTPNGLASMPGASGGGKASSKEEKIAKGAGKNAKDTAPDDHLVFRSKENASHDEDLLLTVLSKKPSYFKRLVFDKYDGHNWTQTGRGTLAHCEKLGTQYQELGGVESLYIPPKLHTTSLFQEYTTSADLGRCIPVSYIPQQLDFPTEPVIVDQFGCLQARKAIVAGTRYALIAQEPDYSLDEMRGHHVDRAEEERLSKNFANYLQLPKNLSPEVTALAKRVAGTDGNWFAKADRICQYLRTNYKYVLDLSEPKSKDEMAHDFLCTSKQGACGQFATAFVVMCRSVGVPARCVSGFSPGDYNSSQGFQEIRNKHAHAWGEVYAPGYEWVPFDSTPTGRLPVAPTPSLLDTIKENIQHTIEAITPKPMQLPSPSVVTAGKRGADSGSAKPAVSKSLPKQSKASKATKKETKPAEKKKTVANPVNFTSPKFSWRQIIWLIVIVPASMLLVQAIKSAAEQMRLSDLKQLQESPKPSTILFLKVANDLKRLKISRHPTDTPEDLLARFNEASAAGLKVHPELQELCTRFVELYCADRFGCDDATEFRNAQLKEIGEKIHTLVRTRPAGS